MIGKTISHYKILEKLGEGGMGIVYKAEDTKLDRLVALKFLPPQLSINEEEKKRFIHEAKAAAALDHNNICAIHEIDETGDGQMFIAMGFYQGQTLKDKIEKRPLPIDEAINITIQIAEGLNKAHKKEIIHRDIKSANILITDEGIVKILDFGLAKLRGQTKLTKEGTTLGTVAYMSPEQTTGEEADHRSDIWSLGVLLYEMVTGQLPFKGEYDQAIMYSIMNEEPEPVTGLRTGVPVELERIINKAIAKESIERYQGIADLLVDLVKVKRDSKPEVISAKLKDKPEILFKISPKFLILGIFIIVAIFIAGYFIFKGKAEPEIPYHEPGSMPSLAIVYFENKSGDKNLDNWRDAFSELLTTDLSQSKYIKVLRSDEIYGIFKKLNLLEAKRYSTQDLKEVAKNGRVNHVLKGSYMKAGDDFVITAMLVNASSGKTISALSVRAAGEKDIFPKVDELTREIKLKLALTRNQISGDIDRNVSAITTSSAEALQYYLEGRKYFQSGVYRKSITFMEKAIKIDPEFAMAYRSIAIAYKKFFYPSEVRKYLRKAMELSHRLSDRERYIIQGDYYKTSEKTWNKAIEAYKKVLQLYPLDSIANTNLGSLYIRLGKLDKAIERNEVLIRNKVESHNPYCNLSYFYLKKGLIEKAKKILEYYLNDYQDHWDIRSCLADCYCIQRKFDLAIIEAEKAISLAPKLYYLYQTKGNIYLFKGDFINAEKTFRKLLEFDEKTTKIIALRNLGVAQITQGQLAEAETQFKHAMKIAKENKMRLLQLKLTNNICYIYFLTGKYEGCLKELNKNLTTDKEIDLSLYNGFGQYLKTVVCLKMNSTDRLKKEEDELLKWVKKRKNKKLIMWYYLFLGKKELKKKNFSGAIENSSKAVSLLDYQYISNIENDYHALFFNSLAQAYIESGNMEKAQNQFEKITALTIGRYRIGDIYAKAFYKLGKIYQHKGLRGKAIESYRKFIDLWKNCDSIFRPMLEDAREKVKELERKK